jgi:hypothetical protein
VLVLGESSGSLRKRSNPLQQFLGGNQRYFAVLVR